MQTYKQSIAFDFLWECTGVVSKKYKSHDVADLVSAKKWQDSLLDINPEGSLLREIRDVMDELFIMDYIKKQELSVTQAFVKQVRFLLKSSPKVICSRNQNEDVSHSGTRTSATQSDGSSPLLSKVLVTIEDIKSSHELTEYNASELLEKLQAQLSDLDTFRSAAENTSIALKDLLSLKQQQASLVEAREAVKQGEETLRQGRAIMLFTIVTIIFVSARVRTCNVQRTDEHLATSFFFHWYLWHECDEPYWRGRGQSLRLV